MGAKAGLSMDALVAATLKAADENDVPTLAAVAGHLGVRPPSLYNHVSGLAELRAIAASQVLEDLADAAGEAVMGRSDDDAVAHLMMAYRDYVTRFPRRYALLTQEDMSSPAILPAATRLLGVIAAAVRGYGLTTDEDTVHVGHCIHIMAHGFVLLQMSAGYGHPESADTTFKHLTNMLIAGLRAWPRD